jgi:GNAT superfamily N-acetyltransferase
VTVTVSYLVMYAPEQLRPKYPDDPHLQIQPVHPPRWQFNQSMYRRIGGDWYWQEKRDWEESRWRAYVEAPGLHSFAASYAGELAGYFELRHDPHGGIEIAYFGLLAEFIGKGLGGAMLSRALQYAWALGPERVWVHTCTLDHPAALANYGARGMRIYRTGTEAVSGND